MTKERKWYITIVILLLLFFSWFLQRIIETQFAYTEPVVETLTPTNQEVVDSETTLTENVDTVLPNVITPAVVGDGCFVAGCSNQICTDIEDLQTMCEWHDTYACYNNATCERQPDGECGWTRTDEIMQCIKETVPEIASLI